VTITYSYVSPGLTVDRFLVSEGFLVGLRGPIGGGKSTACVMKILKIANQQPIAKDGRKHSRFAIIRNTYPELVTTTIKTWHQWVPESIGSWRGQGPPTHRIIDNKLDMEVIFVSLDRPQDVRKVLGMELTAAWINEAREVGKELLDGLTGRVGRFPAERDGGCVGPQILMDTNPPQVDHWWYVLAEADTSSQRNAELVESVQLAEAEMRGKGLLAPKQPLFEFFAQPSALGPDAENLQNLPVAYYAKASAGKSDEWKKVYIHGEYGFVQDGRPMYPEFREQLHVKAFELNPRLPLSLGVDYGLTPAATIGQRSFTGIQRVRWEVVSEHMGAKQFADVLRGFISQHCSQFSFDSMTGDPAGDADSQSDSEQSCFKIMRANGFPEIKAAHTNDPTIRREAHAQALSRIIDGQAGWQVHPQGCPTLRRGMAGQYRYRRVQMVGDDRYHDKPEKNAVSHVCEADQYRMLGCGEGRVVIRGALGGKRIRPPYALM
jgi:hypothetical protein